MARTDWFQPVSVIADLSAAPHRPARPPQLLRRTGRQARGGAGALELATSKLDFKRLAHGARRLTLSANRVKARFERDRFSMRGLLMALLAFDAPSLNANHWAGRIDASPRSSKTPFLAKKTTKTTTKTV
ncbi:hypothetical protein ACVDG5_026700 [Mesorhizobium sp. ORM6]